MEGHVYFAAFPATRFRYRLSGHAGDTNIWLENGSTKEQWACSIDCVSDCAPKGVNLPLDVLIKYLAAAFSVSGQDTSNHQLLLERKDGELVLKAHLQLFVESVKWAPEFVFGLTGVPLEKVDILESKLSDLEEQMHVLKGSRSPVQFVNLTASAKGLATDDLVTWCTKLNSQIVSVAFDSTDVIFTTDGVYQFHGVVYGSGDPCTLHLEINDKLVQTLRETKCGAAMIAYVGYCSDGDVLCLRHKCRNVHKAHLAIARLG